MAHRSDQKLLSDLLQRRELKYLMRNIYCNIKPKVITCKTKFQFSMGVFQGPFFFLLNSWYNGGMLGMLFNSLELIMGLNL